MGFKKREYNFYKKLCEETLYGGVPNHELYGCEPIFPPSILLNMLPDYIEANNFEACKAIEDSIREFFLKHGVEIPPEATLRIPPKDTDEVHGIICLISPGDKLGMGSAAAIWF